MDDAQLVPCSCNPGYGRCGGECAGWHSVVRHQASMTTKYEKRGHTNGTLSGTVATPSPAVRPCDVRGWSCALPDPSFPRHHRAPQFCERISGAHPNFGDLDDRPFEADRTKTFTCLH